VEERSCRRNFVASWYFSGTIIPQDVIWIRLERYWWE